MDLVEAPRDHGLPLDHQRQARPDAAAFLGHVDREAREGEDGALAVVQQISRLGINRLRFRRHDHDRRVAIDFYTELKVVYVDYTGGKRSGNLY